MTSQISMRAHSTYHCIYTAIKCFLSAPTVKMRCWRPYRTAMATPLYHFVSTACSSERRSMVRSWCATVGVRDCNAPTSAFCITRISSRSQPGVTVLLDQRFLFFLRYIRFFCRQIL